MVNIGISLILLSLSSGIIAGITAVVIVLFAFAFFPFLKKSRKLNQIYSDSRSVSTGKIADVITNIWNLQSHAK